MWYNFRAYAVLLPHINPLNVSRAIVWRGGFEVTGFESPTYFYVEFYKVKLQEKTLEGFFRSRGDSPSGVQHPASHLQAGVFAKGPSMALYPFVPALLLGSKGSQKPFESPIYLLSTQLPVNINFTGYMLIFGAGGIRTPGTLRFNGFQDRLLQPLGHRSRKGDRKVV